MFFKNFMYFSMNLMYFSKKFNVFFLCNSMHLIVQFHPCLRNFIHSIYYNIDNKISNLLLLLLWSKCRLLARNIQTGLNSIREEIRLRCSRAEGALAGRTKELVAAWRHTKWPRTWRRTKRIWCRP